jgi:hypothetical protein
MKLKGLFILKKLPKFLLFLVLSAVTVVGTSRAAPALTFDFLGGFGGLVSYSGGYSALSGYNLPVYGVLSVPPGFSSTTLIQGGSMAFTTGNYTGPTGSGEYAFSSGGSLTITGGISAFGIAPGSTLMQATFASSPTLDYLGWSAAWLSAGLSISYLNPTMLAGFGAPPLGTGTGALTQVELFLQPASLPFGPGVGFTATQAGAKVTSTVSALPEPASLLLLGSGLTVLGLIGLRRSSWRTHGKSAFHTLRD